MTGLDKFTFFRSFWEAVKRLPKKDRYPVLEAMIEYGLDGVEPKVLTDPQLAYFLLVEPVLKKGRSKAESGKLGGSRPKANDKQTVTHKEMDKEKEKDIQEEKKEKEESAAPNARSRLHPPTVEEVRGYCVEMGYAAVDPQRFTDYYTANGWRVGKNPMKDWKAAVRGWESREKERRTDSSRNSGSHGVDRLAQMYREEFGDG